MASYKTKGIVVGRTNFGEADRIITFLTPDRGKVKAVAKGSRRIKSKLGPHLELFNEVDLVLAKGRNLGVITGARLIGRPVNVGQDLKRMALGYLAAELAVKLVDEGHETALLYGTVAEILADIQDRPADAVGELYLKLGFLEGLGYRPVLDRCVSCGQKLLPAGEYWFNASLGGVVDNRCGAEKGAPISREQIKLWRLLLAQPLSAARAVDGITKPATASLGLIDAFYGQVFGRRFLATAFAEAS